MRTFLIAGAAALFSVAHAEEPQTCFRELPITERLVADALENDASYFAGDERLAPFLVGHLSYLREGAQGEDGLLISGEVLFIRRGENWTAVAPFLEESAVGIYRSTREPFVIVVLQRKIESPAPGYTIVRSTDGLATGACTTIDFPEALNNPDWAMETLKLRGMQIDRRGRGRFVASAEIDRDTEHPRTTWWRYETRDGGATWSAPRALGGPRSAGRGVLEEVSTPAPEEAKAALRAYARGRE
jgi:hypothetical protein